MFKKLSTIFFVSLLFVPGTSVFAAVTSSASMPEVRAIQQEWARLYYLDEFLNNNYRELQALARKANSVASDHPQSAEALVWDAIVLSTLAEKKGGIGALSLVREARLRLEQAEAIDASVLGGSVYASLGTLYAKVPGWPLGFGSDEKAEYYFNKALALNPDGLDINYFYAEYLYHQGEDARALAHIEKALNAPPLAGRPVADRGRRAQALNLRKMLAGS